MTSCRLRSTSWTSRPRISFTVTAEIARKPDPACLDRVVDACHPVGMLFVGDGPDDQRLVANYRMHRDTTMPVKFALVARADQPASSSGLTSS